MIRLLPTLWLFLTLTLSHAAQPLVTPEWLQSNKAHTELVILDLQPAQSYQRYHIPGAVNTNYADWRRPSKARAAQVMTPAAELEKLIGELGISNDSHVILVTTGQSAGEIASAARIYWSFKVLGHDAVSILDGGLIAYADKRRYRLEKGTNKPQASKFKATLRPDYMPDAQMVVTALEKGALAVDNRSRAEYLGIYAGSGKERAGSLPNAVNLNYDWLTVNGGGKLQSLDNIKKIYSALQIPLNGPQINYCHTGHRASLGWFVSHELLGNKQARLYDGSTEEWAVDRSLPMEQKIPLTF